MHSSVLFPILISKVCSFALPQRQSMMDILMKRYENTKFNKLMYQNQNNLVTYQNPWQMEQNINSMDRNFENNTSSTNCCTNFPCPNPCFPPSGYSMSAPIIVPARAVFEPVVHNHPPLHKIKRIIRRDKRKWRKHWSSSSSSSNEFSSSSADTETDSDWY